MASKLRPAFKDKRNNVILLQDRISKTSKFSLRPGLRARRITPYSRNIQPIPSGAIIINFGATDIPTWVRRDMVLLNPPDAIRDSANKLQTFAKLKAAEIPHVRWTVERTEAVKWIGKGHKVLARVALASSGGRGIKVASSDAELAEAPLYTRYFPKTHEFRVHVVDGQAIDTTEKKLREEFREDREKHSLVRSHDNGWVHAHDALSIGNDEDLATIKRLAVGAIAAVGLDFGAVDILACLSGGGADGVRRLTKAVVCEVNSAPGIENEVTKRAYVNALNALIAKKGG